MPYKDPEKRRAYQREYRKKNKDKLGELNKEWREKNPERSREICKKAGLKHYYNNREEINQKASERNQTQEWKEYQAAWYEDNKDRISQKSRERYMNDPEWRDNRRISLLNRRRERAKWLRDYKSKQQCSVCEESESSCLDFHHRDPSSKEGLVCKMVASAASLERIEKEINKCDILCSNCHRKLHAKLKNKGRRNIC